FLSLLFTSFFFFFHATASTAISTLSLHDALPICCMRFFWIENFFASCGRDLVDSACGFVCNSGLFLRATPLRITGRTTSRCRSGDRKSTRLNSSHLVISYAVLCLKKKKKI